MRLLICAGGTGGGVYPALAVLEKMKAEGGRRKDELHPSSFIPHPSDVLWVGGDDGMEAELVKRANVAFTTIPAAGLHGVGLRALSANARQLGRGLAAARRVLREFHPHVLLFTGGYLAAPMALAARLPRLGIPRPRSLLYVPDIEPGLALKWLSRFTDHIAVTAEESRAYFPRRAALTVTGYPVRGDLQGWVRESAGRALGLSPDLPALLVFGGSKGARSINRALLGALPQLLAEMQVVHISGVLDWPEVEVARAALSASQAACYHAYPYLHAEMGAALACADLVLSRAGAATLGEYPLFGLPAVLAPYPHAWRYQRVNAEYLARRGAAVMLADEDLPDRLLPVVLELMHSPSRRAAMRQSMQTLARPTAAASIAELLLALAETRSSGS